MQMMKKRLGDILLEMGGVDGLQLQSALAYQRTWGVPLGQVVVDLRFCSAEQVLRALSCQAGVPATDLDAEPLDPKLTKLVPRRLAERHRVVPLRLEGPRDELVVAIAAPANLHSLDAVRSVTRRARVVPMLASDSAIARAIERLYLDDGAGVARRAEVEAIQLPEAEADMVLSRDCMASLVEDGVPAFSERAIHLPDLDPRREVLELPLLEPLEVEELAEFLALTEVAPPAAMEDASNVLIYGWSEEVAAGLLRLLGEAGFQARVVGADWLLSAGDHAVVLSPLPALEELERLPRAQLLVAGKEPERDVMRAQALGARGFLAAPLDTELLLRAVKRLVKAAHAPTRSHASC